MSHVTIPRLYSDCSYPLPSRLQSMAVSLLNVSIFMVLLGTIPLEMWTPAWSPPLQKCYTRDKSRSYMICSLILYISIYLYVYLRISSRIS